MWGREYLPNCHHTAGRQPLSVSMMSPSILLVASFMMCPNNLLILLGGVQNAISGAKIFALPMSKSLLLIVLVGVLW
jgi:hypothetical protein